MTGHRKLCEIAEEAIDDVFSDRSVTPEKTMDSLEDLSAMIDLKIECIKSDLRKKGLLP